MRFAIALFAVTLGFSQTPPEAPGSLTAATFAGLHLRSIGPGGVAGRVTCFAVNPRNHAEYYICAASGGVWKTNNDGITWKPVFDDQGSYSIATISLDPKNANTVWVGTGENNSQRSVSYGDGIYRSDDGGKTWRNLGLKTSEHIGRILIDPRDSNVIYVAAAGPLWAPGGDRGVFKSTDGGKNWKNVLTISDNTGVNDVEQDPNHPDTLLAAAYQRRRHQWTLIDGGPESAIYKSDDAGLTWRKIKTGLPAGDIGRIGMAFSLAQPGLVYARVEATDKGTGIYRSTDSGESWEKRSDFGALAMYYSQIIADPKFASRIYIPDTNLSTSDDGGKTVRRLGDRNKHSDSHTVWIDPDNPDHLLVGCDGGVYETWERGATWQFKANLPITQFYDVDADNSKPYYYVYGGTQDNASLGGPSRNRSASGIPNSDWFITTFGDGFVSRVDPQDPDTVYAESQNGVMVRYNRKTGEKIGIQPQETKNDAPLRWNWDAPMIVSPHSHTRLYFGAQFLYRSDDRGNSWKKVSDDLTRHLDRNQLPVMGRVWPPDAVAKNTSTAFYGNISTIAESSKTEGLLYVGTDDGLVQVSENGGARWRKCDLPGVPERAYMARVFASQLDAGTVYAAADNHKNGDFKPYLLKSTDRGVTWTHIESDLPENGAVLAIAEDPVNAKLLFIGTEFGVYFTLDGGGKWIKLRGGMPTIAVKDLVIQKRENDLVLATFGRGIYILDDYTPLRNLTADSLKQEALLFAVKPATEYIEAQPLGLRGKAFQGEAYFTAENPPAGAVFTYYLRDSVKSIRDQRKEAEKEAEKKKQELAYPALDRLVQEAEEEPPALTLVVTDARGAVVRRLTAPNASGFHRVAWDLRYPAPILPPPRPPVEDDEDTFFGPPAGFFVPPGTYKVTLMRHFEGKTVAMGEPRAVQVDSEQSAAQTDFSAKLNTLRKALGAATEVANSTKARLAAIQRAIQESSADERLYDQAEALAKRLQSLMDQLNGTPELQRRQENQRDSISDRIQTIVFETRLTTEPPTQTQQDSYSIAAGELSELVGKLRTLVNTDLPALEKQMDAAGVPHTPGRVPEWPAR
ncbi:MAG TPA: hypothetical protein VKG25_16520 [Bryobacteraceae bacterium]|nr:hypothetical protein [Bryobacteraceae bacterium]